MSSIVVCPQCGTPAATTGAHCIFCGALLSAPPPAPEPERRCAHCGAAIPEQARFCSACGHPAEEQQGSSPVLQDNILVPAPGQDVILIGRDQVLQNTGHCYLDHPAISLQHARLEKRGPAWYIVDLDSSRGTFVNYHRVVPGPAGWLVTEQDIIWVAPYAFRLCTQGKRSTLQPAHMRLDAQGLHRTVGQGLKQQTILDMRRTPLAFVPGEFIALVGGSGSGKSTLIKALNGLSPAQQGQILIDGHPIIDGQNAQPFTALYSIVGYVPQDDVMYRDLTVTDLMWSVARLRLADLSRVETKIAIEEALDAVDLRAHEQKLISHLSGGQRKRVNIAMELLARPRLLFLDEPTSGLDPGLDLEVMRLLRDWARGGKDEDGQPRDPKTIILVTHATENIELCDYIAFMEPGGRLAYFGPPEEAKLFFFPDQDPTPVSYSQLYRRVAEGPPASAEGAKWADIYLQSPLYQRYVVERSGAIMAGVEEQSQATPAPPARLPLKSRIKTAAGQCGVLTSRFAQRIFRDRFNAAFMFLQPPLVAWLLSGVASKHALRPGPDAIDAQKVLFILACAMVWLGVINATKAIVTEQEIYARERRYGLGPVPYVLSKMAVFGSIGLVQTLLLLFFLRFVVNLPEEGVLGSIDFEYGVALFLSLAAGLALGLLISSLATTTDLASTLMFVVLILQVIFSGLLFAPKGFAEVPAALTISRWSLRALGSSTDLNQLLGSIIRGYEFDNAFKAETGHVLGMWAILLVYLTVCVIATSWLQWRKR